MVLFLGSGYTFSSVECLLLCIQNCDGRKWAELGMSCSAPPSSGKKRKKRKRVCVVYVFKIIYGKSTFTFIPYKSNRLVFVERTVAGPLFIQQLKLQTAMYNHLKMSYSFGKDDC